jgi:hypothetical protein
MYGIIIQRDPSDPLGITDDQIEVCRIDNAFKVNYPLGITDDQIEGCRIDNAFKVKYVDNEDKDNIVAHSFVANKEQLIGYIQSILNLLKIDYKPFKAVQIVLPIFPSIVVLIEDLDEDSIKYIVDTFQKCVDLAPGSL